MHKIRTDKVRGEPMPASQEEWEQIAAQIRASLGVQP
jgi:hypothetical protein